jgi:hypothetical protein
MKRTGSHTIFNILKRVKLFLLLMSHCLLGHSQTDSTSVNGQITSWAGNNFIEPAQSFFGGRFLPELYYGRFFSKGLKLDAQLSPIINLNYISTKNTFPEFFSNIQPYRVSFRLYSEQWEIRTGLQKISFGSATLLRPLMWFDATDPRDPLKVTQGVYGTLARYYFLNNVNIWAWGLWGNRVKRGWDLTSTSINAPEFGGRLQLPLLSGEAGLSYHHRKAENLNISQALSTDTLGFHSENKIGIDGKWTLVAGLWFEYVFKYNSFKTSSLFTREHYLTLGADYTFGIGNGINLLIEHLIYKGPESGSSPNTTLNITASSLSYPLGLMNRISAMVYRSWSTKSWHSVLNLQRQYDNLSIYAMVFMNPDSSYLFPGVEGRTLFAGKGVTLMLSYNF